MENAKIENLLNLALDATPEEREKSEELDVGYDEEERTWEVIVKTGGDEAALRAALREYSPEAAERIRITNLSNEYMILVIPEAFVKAVAALPLIEYMEKPKRLFFAVNNGKRASCITALQTGGTTGSAIPGSAYNLTGKNVIVAVIDSGERVIVLQEKRCYNKKRKGKQKRKGLEGKNMSDEISRMPKIDLHCHLDGSMTPESMRKILGREIRLEEVQAGDTCRNLSEYLDKFELPIRCIRTAEGLETASREFLLRAAEENTRYVEVRFAPLLSVNENLNCRQVVEAVLKGLSEAKEQCGTAYNVIVCAMRHHAKEDSLAMMKVCREFLGEGVCAVDLAGDEAAYPMEDFKDLFAQAKKLGFPFTIHAGECGRVENVLEAVECGAARIGHGIALAGNRKAQELCAGRKIGIELCPTSNLQTRAASEQSYPVREFMDAGLCVTLNTDNRTVSNTDMTKEMRFVQERYAVTDSELKGFFLNAVDVAFADDSVRQELWKLV